MLDINDEEARALLLSIDPLAALVQTQEQIHERLLELTPAEAPELDAAWRAAVRPVLLCLRDGLQGGVWPNGTAEFFCPNHCDIYDMIYSNIDVPRYGIWPSLPRRKRRAPHTYGQRWT